jgi:hypothetical protein
MNGSPANLKSRRRGRSAFTLIEALVASTLLGVVVLAVISAVTTSQQMSFEGQKTILAAMAADDLMAELVVLDYNDLKLQDNVDQAIGSLQTLGGSAYTDAAWALGRHVEVTEETLFYGDLGVWVTGLRVIVEVRDEFRALAVIETFVPEPAA